MTLEEINAKLAENEEKTEWARLQYTKFQEEIMKLRKEAESLEDKKIEYTRDTLGIEYWIENHSKGMKHYDEMIAFWRKNFPSLIISGIWGDTNQVGIKISLTKNDTEQTKAIKKDLEAVLPYVRQLEDGKKRFQILENSLSEFGVYSLTESDGIFEVTKTSYGTTKSIKKGNIDEVLEYIQQNVYYGGDDE